MRHDVTVSKICLVFDDLDSFDELWSGPCRMSLHWGHLSADAFLRIKTRVVGWGGSPHRPSSILLTSYPACTVFAEGETEAQGEAATIPNLLEGLAPT